jgi:hypothetical protein
MAQQAHPVLLHKSGFTQLQLALLQSPGQKTPLAPWAH